MDSEARVETTRLVVLNLFFVSLFLELIYIDNVVNSLMRLPIVTLVARGFRGYDVEPSCLYFLKPFFTLTNSLCHPWTFGVFKRQVCGLVLLDDVS